MFVLIRAKCHGVSTWTRAILNLHHRRGIQTRRAWLVMTGPYVDAEVSPVLFIAWTHIERRPIACLSTASLGRPHAGGPSDEVSNIRTALLLKLIDQQVMNFQHATKPSARIFRSFTDSCPHQRPLYSIFWYADHCFFILCTACVGLSHTHTVLNQKTHTHTHTTPLIPSVIREVTWSAFPLEWQALSLKLQ